MNRIIRVLIKEALLKAFADDVLDDLERQNQEETIGHRGKTSLASWSGPFLSWPTMTSDVSYKTPLLPFEAMVEKVNADWQEWG